MADKRIGGLFQGFQAEEHLASQGTFQDHFIRFPPQKEQIPSPSGGGLEPAPDLIRG